jgi:hypothetical protein
MAGTKGTAEIATRYPVEEGLTARTTKQTGRVMNLVPEGLNGLKSNVTCREQDGVR